MDKQSMSLRRHNTAPSPSAGRSVIASVSVGRRITRHSFLGYRSASMKSNPYVGCFRHSPPTAPRTVLPRKSNWRTSTKNENAPWCSVPVSLKDCKNSPHIGWFRHAPPSRLDISSASSVTLNTSLRPSNVPQDRSIQEVLVFKLLQELNPALDNKHDCLFREDIEELARVCQRVIVSGRLPGGGTGYLEKPRSYRKDLRESSAEGTLSTVNTLSSLASWFLFPLAHDAESCGYRQDRQHASQQSPKKKNRKKRKSKEEGLLSQLSPYLPTFLEEPPLDIPKNEYEKYGNKSPRKGGDNDAAAPVRSSSAVPSEIGCPSTPTGTSIEISNQDLSMSVSSLAEAYYAHHQISSVKNVGSQAPVSPNTSDASSVLGSATVSPQQLDYVITQMDIARMSRNASRHLDVQSILGLPVITYQGGPSKAAMQAPSSTDPHRSGGWSWTIVEETEAQKEESQELATNEQIDFCVICLEHFVYGDRLRVLPCDHSFVSSEIDQMKKYYSLRISYNLLLSFSFPFSACRMH